MNLPKTLKMLLLILLGLVKRLEGNLQFLKVNSKLKKPSMLWFYVKHLVISFRSHLIRAFSEFLED
jgi:hypothetical protein